MTFWNLLAVKCSLENYSIPSDSLGVVSKWLLKSLVWLSELIKGQKTAVLETTLGTLETQSFEGERIRDIERETENFLQKFRDDHMSNYVPDEEIERIIKTGRGRNASQIEELSDSDEETFEKIFFFHFRINKEFEKLSKALFQKF